MKMIDSPVTRERAEDREQLTCFLGRKHGRWFVEDEHVRAAEQCLEDLDPLLLPTR